MDISKIPLILALTPRHSSFDIQLHGTYFVVAPLHLFGLIASFYVRMHGFSDISQHVFQKKHLLKFDLKNECFNGRNPVLPPFRSVVEAFKRVNKSGFL